MVNIKMVKTKTFVFGWNKNKKIKNGMKLNEMKWNEIEWNEIKNKKENW